VIAKVGPKGQIVIPKEVRDALGVRPGSVVSLRWRKDDGVLELTKAWDDAIADAPAYIRQFWSPESRDRSATDELLAMRRNDLDIDEGQAARWTGGQSSSTRNRS
jgi:AbrB family looped-hinge helix DNA binding protein